MPLMRRRPLMRAAAVGGTAYYAGKRRSESQQREQDQEARIEDLESQPPPMAAAPPPPAAAPPPPAAPAPAAGMGPDTIEQLKQLGELHEQGVLTDEEFAAEKAKILDL
jgi:hypothetical protein